MRYGDALLLRVCVQATDEEELTHLQNMLAQAQAAEAEANRRATEAAQRLVSTPRQRDSHLEQALQQVCALHCLLSSPW